MKRLAPHILLLSVLFGGCSLELAVSDTPVPQPPPVRPDPTKNVGQTTIFEDFDNRTQIGAQVGVEVDVNQGILTLPHRSVEVEANAQALVDITEFESGPYLVGREVRLDASQIVTAADSLEIHASERVELSGMLWVGQGGIRIIAGHEIIITGEVISDGPIELIVADRSGLIEISGQVVASTYFEKPSDIMMSGRGSIHILGYVEANSQSQDLGGSILVNTYGAVTIDSSAWMLVTSYGEGSSGNISLTSESELRLKEFAQIGIPHEAGAPNPGGDVTLQGQDIYLEDGVNLYASGTSDRRGGSIFVTATGEIVTGRDNLMKAGLGPDGGSVLLQASRIQTGSQTKIYAGEGSTVAGQLEMRASERLDLGEGTDLRAGDAVCADGGAVVVGVGGTINAEPDTSIRSGNSIQQDTECRPIHSAGDLTIIGRELIGVADAVMLGDGDNPGTLRLEVDPDFEVPAPNLDVAIGGMLESKTILRDPSSLGALPSLVYVEADKPEGTTFRLLICGAQDSEGPFENWIDLETIDPQAPASDFATLRGASHFRYRVELTGKTFDAPTIDFFQIDLQQ